MAGLGLVAVVLIAVCIALTATIRDQLMAQVDDRLRSLAPSGRLAGQEPPSPFDELGARPASTLEDALSQRISDAYQGFVNADGELVTLFAPNLADRVYPTPVLEPSILEVDQPVILTVAASCALGSKLETL